MSPKIKPAPKSKTSKPFLKPTSQECLHYMVELEKLLKVKCGKDIAHAPSDLRVLRLFAEHDATRLGEKDVERIRRRLQKILPKYKPEED